MGSPVDDEAEVDTRAAVQAALEQLSRVLDGLKDIKAAVDHEVREAHLPPVESRPDAKVIPFPGAPRK